jgi:hypothetical protein
MKNIKHNLKIKLKIEIIKWLVINYDETCKQEKNSNCK